MNPLLGALVLAASGALVIFSLRNFYAPASRFNLAIGRAGIVTFAVLAACAFWGQQRARTVLTSTFYELPADPAGIQTVTIRKPLELRGYRARLVMKEDRTPAPASLHEKSRECRWEVPGKHPEFHIPDMGVGWPYTLFDVDTEDASIELRYSVTPETRPVLSQVVLEVTASRDQTNALAIGAGFAEMFMVVCLLAMLLAALGVVAQRRKQRALAAAGKSGPPTS